MRERNSHRLVLIGALLVFGTGFAAAQSENADTADNEATERVKSRESGDSADVVYTTDYLKRQFAGKSDTSSAVYTNESLSEEPEAPTQTSEGAFTNEDLRQRFGASQTAEAVKSDDDASAEAGVPERAAEPAAEGGQPPTMSAEERTQRIAEIDGELKRLEQRLLAIRNPLLGGTVPPTPKEQTEEASLDNAERLRRTEAKIDELEAALEELRARPKDQPDE